jgi:CheY-like chemotaxis protein
MVSEAPLARILIADDEPLYLRTTAELLRKAGYECTSVRMDMLLFKPCREDHSI